MRIPLLVELCAGTAALSLRLERSKARPPVSRMGAKTGYADAILSRMGLHPGQGADHYLLCEPDPGCRLLLEAYRDRALALAAAEHIRGWKDEEPRALWERLRSEGPAKCAVDPREVARWVWCGGHAYRKGDLSSGYQGTEHAKGKDRHIWRSQYAALASLPTLPATITDDARTVDPREVARELLLIRWSFSQRGPARGYGGPGTDPGHMAGRDEALGCDRSATRLTTLPTLPATITDDARTVDPREVARWALMGAWSYRQGIPDSGPAVPGECHQTERPGIATRLDSLPVLDATLTDDARTVDPPQLPAGSWVYIDPPYVGTTGYGHALGRDEVVALARRWREAGAHVAVSEAEPIAELVADGWHAHELSRERVGQKRTFSKQQREVLTISRAPRGQLGLL